MAAGAFEPKRIAALQQERREVAERLRDFERMVLDAETQHENELASLRQRLSCLNKKRGRQKEN